MIWEIFFKIIKLLFVCADHAEPYVSIALRTIAGIIRIFAATLVATGVPRGKIRDGSLIERVALQSDDPLFK